MAQATTEAKTLIMSIKTAYGTLYVHTRTAAGSINLHNHIDVEIHRPAGVIMTWQAAKQLPGLPAVTAIDKNARLKVVDLQVACTRSTAHPVPQVQCSVCSAWHVHTFMVLSYSGRMQPTMLPSCWSAALG